jgi:hypothetical protein
MRITESRLRQIVKQMLKENILPAPPVVPAKDPGAQPVGQLNPEMMNQQLQSLGAPQFDNARAQALITTYIKQIKTPDHAYKIFYNAAVAKPGGLRLTPQELQLIQHQFLAMTSVVDALKAIYPILVPSKVLQDTWFKEIGPLLFATLVCAHNVQTPTGPVAGSFTPPPAGAPATSADLSAQSPTPLAAGAAGITKGGVKNWNDYVKLTTPPAWGEKVKNAWMGYAQAVGQPKVFGAFVKWYNDAKKAAGKHLNPVEVTMQLNKSAKTAGVGPGMMGALDQLGQQPVFNSADPGQAAINKALGL